MAAINRRNNMDYELIFWVVAGIASVVALVLLRIKAARGSKDYIDWIDRGEW